MNKKTKILIIDDNAELCDSLRDVLECNGYTIGTANSGNDAIHLLQNNGYDIALVDFKLPDISGTELVGNLASISPSIEFILITAHATLDSAIEAVKHERIISYELKPLDMDRLLIILNQVVKRKKAEEEIQKLTHAVEQSSSVVLITDTEGNIEYANSRFTQLTGYSLEDAIGKTPRILKSGKTSPEIYRKLWKTIQSGNEWRGELCNKKKNGELYWELASISPVKNSEGVITSFISVKEDITERKRIDGELRLLNESLGKCVAERTEELRNEIIALKQKEKELKNYGMLFDNISDLAYICDREGKILFLNKVFDKLTGCKSAEFVGKAFTPLFDGEDLKKAMELYSRTLKGEKLQEEVRFKDTGVLCEYRNIPLRDGEGKIIGVIGTARDITDRKRAEEQIKESLKEKETLLMEIHHRVRNNLQVISSLLLLHSRGLKDEHSIKVFKDAQSRIQSMAAIHEILYKTNHLSDINFYQYIRILIGQLFSSYGIDPDKISLKISIKDVSLNIEQAIPLGLIVNELLSNSLKHAFPFDKIRSGSFDLDRVKPEEHEIRISLTSAPDNKIKLIVCDNGVGMPKDLDIRTSDSLGLDLVTVITENQLKGEVDLDRSVKGTKFQIIFGS